MINSKAGRVVWRDLLTPNDNASRQFFERVAGWRYLFEHATDFAWGGGESDFVLALLDGEAGAGILTQSEVQFRGWVHYVEVKDIDRSTQLAVDLGGAVVKPPFDVPGVGRNSLLCDPLGAYVGIAVSEHDYPIPSKQFGPDLYLVGEDEFPTEFYQQMFDWRTESEDSSSAFLSKILLGEDVVAYCAADRAMSGSKAAWLPAIRVSQLEEALHQIGLCNGSVLETITYGAHRIASDPTGLLFGLVEA